MRVLDKPLSSRIIRWSAPIVVFGFILRGLAARWPIGQGDSATYVDFLTFKTSGKPLMSDLTLSPWNIFGSHGYMYDSASQFCKRNFFNAYEGISNIHWHPHLIVFLTGYLYKLFFFLPAWVFALCFEALSYTLGIFVIVNYLKKNHAAKIHILTLTFVLLSSPLFIRSLLGQPYLDRLAFGPLIAFVIFRFSRTINSWRMQGLNVGFIISIALISERAALTVGLLSITLILSSRKRGLIKIHDVYCFLFSILPIVWFLYWKSQIATSDYYTNINLQGMKNNFQLLFTSSRSHNLLTYLLVVFPLIFIILVGSFKLFLVAVTFLIPNLLVNVGGAELTGYYTHYHAMYLPIIWALATVSLVKYSSKSKRTKFPRSTLLAFVLISTILSILSITRVNETNQSFTMNIVRNSGKMLASVGLYEPSDYKVIRDSYSKFLSQLDLHSNNDSISAPEIMFPMLLNEGFKKIDYFPVGVGSSDYLIVPIDPKLGTPDISVYGLMPKELRDQAGGCFQSKIDSLYTKRGKYSLLGSEYNLYSRTLLAPSH